MVRSRYRSAVLLSGVLVGLTGARSAVANSQVVGSTVNIPPPAPNTYSTSVRYDSNGVLYAWNGLTVSQLQSDGTFAVIGQVPNGNNADAGPISFSGDGTKIILSNGAGGYAGSANSSSPFNGEVFQMPKGGGNLSSPIATVPFTGDILPVPASFPIPGASNLYFVDQGSDATGDSSFVSVFNSSNGSNVPVISDIPGASASLAFNPANNQLYAEVGYGAAGGEIKSFPLNSLATALTSGAIDFSAGNQFGSVIDPNQSGAGLFFDAEGYLLSGGAAGVTAFTPNGDVAYQQDPTDSTYATIAYNPSADQVLEVTYGEPGTVYSAGTFVPEPDGLALAVIAGTGLLGRKRRTVTLA